MPAPMTIPMNDGAIAVGNRLEQGMRELGRRATVFVKRAQKKAAARVKGRLWAAVPNGYSALSYAMRTAPIVNLRPQGSYRKDGFSGWGVVLPDRKALGLPLTTKKGEHANNYYPLWLEYGTKHVKGHSWIRGTTDKAQPREARWMADEIATDIADSFVKLGTGNKRKAGLAALDERIAGMNTAAGLVSSHDPFGNSL